MKIVSRIEKMMSVWDTWTQFTFKRTNWLLYKRRLSILTFALPWLAWLRPAMLPWRDLKQTRRTTLYKFTLRFLGLVLNIIYEYKTVLFWYLGSWVRSKGPPTIIKSIIKALFDDLFLINQEAFLTNVYQTKNCTYKSLFSPAVLLFSGNFKLADKVQWYLSSF